MRMTERPLTHHIQAKVLRMSNDPQGAIAVLQQALEAPQTFVQADALVRPSCFPSFCFLFLVSSFPFCPREKKHPRPIFICPDISSPREHWAAALLLGDKFRRFSLFLFYFMISSVF
jgi:hypothetical protein